MRKKTFEIEIGNKFYLGEYSWQDNKLFIEECFRSEEDETNTEIDSLNNSEEFNKVYAALEKEKSDERMSEAEYNAELRYSIAEEKADSKRKYND